MNRCIAIVGGGPAGAFTAHLLAQDGCKVVLFDEKLAWEKPCGGGVTHKALEQYPFLAEAAVERRLIRGCELISPKGRRAYFHLGYPLAIFSRRVLNGLLLKMAHESGAELIRDRVVAIEPDSGGWRVRTRTSSHTADFLVIAAGARNPFRAQFSQTVAAADLMATIGYYVPGSGEDIQVRFLPALEGYIWIFPRTDHLSVGICGKMDRHTTADLRVMLERHLHDSGMSLDGAVLYAHVLPAWRAETLLSTRFCGDGWALVGDAAGFVDPITGEGLYYALRSAELLAQAIRENDLGLYEKAVRQDFLAELVKAARSAGRFYNGRLLGRPLLERMVQFASASERFRGLMREVLAGTQGYVGLRRRVARIMIPVLFETFLGWEKMEKQPA
jgi:geranylgeranyl reductase family protein